MESLEIGQKEGHLDMGPCSQAAPLIPGSWPFLRTGKNTEVIMLMLAGSDSWKPHNEGGLFT